MFSQQIRGSAWSSLILIPLVLLGSVGAARAADDGGGTVPASQGRPTVIDVRVPLDAIVWFDGMEVRGTGALRHFVTPPLESGHRYYYDVRVTWNAGGRAEKQQRHISFRPGERVLVDFAPGSRTHPEPTLFVDPAAPAPWTNEAERDPRNWPNYPDYPRWGGRNVPVPSPNPAAGRLP